MVAVAVPVIFGYRAQAIAIMVGYAAPVNTPPIKSAIMIKSPFPIKRTTI